MIACIMMLWGLSVAVSMGHKLPLQEEGACFSMFNYEYHVVQKLVSLEGSQEKNDEKIQAQKDQTEAANERLEKLEQSLKEQSEQLKTMGKKMEVQTEQYQENLTNLVQTHKEQIAAMEDHLEEMKQQSETQAEQIPKLSSVKSGKQVAFSVYNLKSALIGKTPTFGYTTVNTGSFDMSTGKFTCPTAGHYHFSFSFEHSSGSSGNAYCYFQVNGSGNPYVAVRQGPYQVASGSIIQHLSVNDVVSLTCGGWSYVRKSTNNAIFSGFLISQD